jgi:hypothetical protein
MEVIFMAKAMLQRPTACSGAGALFQENPMKVLMIVAASLALALAGCNRDNAGAGRTANPKPGSSAAGGSSSMTTPNGAATGQGSEGSTDSSTAPKRPASR